MLINGFLQIKLLDCWQE